MSKATPARSTAPSACKAASLAEGAGLAHDAGNLLGALGLYCDLLQAPGVLRPEHQHYAAELRKLAERSGAMIQRLLRANLPETADEASESCNPAEVLGEQEPLLRGVVAPWSSVSVEVEDGITSVPVSAEMLERITLNLVRNSGQAIQKEQQGTTAGQMTQGRICVSLRREGPNVELHVEDDGPGLSPTMAAAFLHPTPLPAGAARGLGHRIVHELVQRSGGQIAVRVRPGRGTTFTITWPMDNERPTSSFGREGSCAC